MGYKAWIGGKSAWVSTTYGVKREFGKDVGTYPNGTNREFDEEREYIFLTTSGDYISSKSLSQAKTMAGPGAIQISEKTKKDVGRMREIRRKKRKFNKG